MKIWSSLKNMIIIDWLFGHVFRCMVMDRPSINGLEWVIIYFATMVAWPSTKMHNDLCLFLVSLSIVCWSIGGCKYDHGSSYNWSNSSDFLVLHNIAIMCQDCLEMWGNAKYHQQWSWVAYHKRVFNILSVVPPILISRNSSSYQAVYPSLQKDWVIAKHKGWI